MQRRIHSDKEAAARGEGSADAAAWRWRRGRRGGGDDAVDAAAAVTTRRRGGEKCFFRTRAAAGLTPAWRRCGGEKGKKKGKRKKGFCRLEEKKRKAFILFCVVRSFFSPQFAGGNALFIGRKKIGEQVLLF
ncbi:hypothetical protein LINPERPRIM_LOCUS5122 [Linum perenne]